MKQFFLFLAFLSIVSCSDNAEFEDSYSDIQIRKSNGVKNAVKKAYQMTDIMFVPKNTIRINNGKLLPGDSVRGMIYSSVKELGTYVGSNVSFYTFMTAINNPRSKIYTERIDKEPYHGTKCRAYYGTVCSGLVSYALGLKPIWGSYDFPVSEKMQEIFNRDSIQVTDVLYKEGHVAMVTNITKDNNNHIQSVEISEAVYSGGIRVSYDYESYLEYLNQYEKILRYKEIENNTEYTPLTEFVVCQGEEPTPFVYNNDICVDKGDKSLYLEREKVVINIMSSYGVLEIYKDGVLYKELADTISDVTLSDLTYGDYKARLKTTQGYSDFTFWKVVEANVRFDQASYKLYFSSANAEPEYPSCCALSGGRGRPQNETFCQTIGDDERRSGYLTIPKEKMHEDLPYIKVLFSTDYGKIISTPINWLNN